MKNINKDLILKAVKINGLAIKHVKEQDDEICLKAVKQNGMALQYVIKQTKEICLEAIKENIIALKYVNIKYVKYMRKYLKSMGNLDKEYNFIITKNINELIEFLNKNVENLATYSCWGIKYTKQDYYLCKLFMLHLDNKKNLISNINYKKLKLCLQVLKTSNKCYKYINKQYISNLLL